MNRKIALLTTFIVMCISTFAQDIHNRSYSPSPVSGAEWDEPGNGNPIVPGYFADPTLRKFGDTYFLYSTTDGTGNGYGPAQVWVSYDCKNWKNIVMNWPTTEVVWAPDVVQQPNGKYRYYYCEPCNINVGESNSPIGPWSNILGKDNAVMVPDRYVHNAITLDPQIFTDDDGSQYLYFTTWGIYKGFGCGVAKLKEGDYDITELQKMRDARYWNESNPYPIAADRFFCEKRLIPNTELKDIFEAPFVFKRNGIYYFTYSSGSCHDDTYRVQYATSKVGPMGPFEYKGEILTTNEDETVHGPGHHSIFKAEGNGKYYIVYHRHNLPRSIHGFNRQICIDSLSFDENGEIRKVVPTHHSIQDIHQKKVAHYDNIAYKAKVIASSYYDEWFKPKYAVDSNNATLWKASGTNWNGFKHKDEWIELDLGKVKSFKQIWTNFEYATFFYQYKIETSLDGHYWTLYADRTMNTMQGSPMIDKGKAKARYIRITITDTQKNGHMPAIWEIKVLKNNVGLPYPEIVEGNDSYPGMHKKDVEPSERVIQNSFALLPQMFTNMKEASDITDVADIWVANKPIHVRVKDGKWGMFFNGTQYLRSKKPLPNAYRYNSPYTIIVHALSTNTGPVSTIVSLNNSRSDLATTELRLGTDPSAGLINHNGSFESYGAPDKIKGSEGKWHTWAVVFDGWKEKVYLDGEIIHEQNNFIMIRPDGHITLGADANGTNNFMGYINQVLITPEAAKEEDIRQLSKSFAIMPAIPSLGDDDFEEIDPDSKFALNPSFNLVHETKEMILEGSHPSFNNSPFLNGAKELGTIEGDFVFMATVEDMEGLTSHSVKAYNEGGIIVAEGNTYYQFGTFPLYNCGNMLTHLSPYGRPQYPNYKGYSYDRYIQFERKGNKLYARSSADGKAWTNSPGSPIEVKGESLRLGTYQTTYSDNNSWVKLKDIKIYRAK